MKRYPAAPQHLRGLSLVELMVALAIGTFLLAGAVTVFGKARDLYRTNEQAARLQEVARFAMSTIEADLRMASYWGLLNNPADISNRPVAGAMPVGIDSDLEDEIDACGNNWAVDVNVYLEGFDGDYPLDDGGSCDPLSSAIAGSDVLTVRHAQVTIMDAAAVGASDGLVKIQASRSQGEIYTGTTVPPGYLPPSSEARRLVVHSYYVDQRSDARENTPSLRRKRLAATGGAPEVIDDEVVSGIEDLQVQIGWDTNGDQNAELYVDPETAGVPAAAVPVAVRVWLMARAEQPEFSFTDDRTYNYANRAGYAPADNFRRLLLSKTIMLRNTRR